MVESGGLENRCTVRYRGFESLPSPPIVARTFSIPDKYLIRSLRSRLILQNYTDLGSTRYPLRLTRLGSALPSRELDSDSVISRMGSPVT